MAQSHSTTSIPPSPRTWRARINQSKATLLRKTRVRAVAVISLCGAGAVMHGDDNIRRGCKFYVCSTHIWEAEFVGALPTEVACERVLGVGVRFASVAAAAARFR